MLADSLGAIGVVDPEVAQTVLSASRSSDNISLARRVAQYLMARTVYATLGVKDDSLKANEIASYVEWCKGKRVLPEYLAGAKGSYGRALLRLTLQGRDLDDSLNSQEISSFEGSLNSDLGDLYNHIRTVGYSENYYRKAYELFRQVGDQSVDKWVWFTESLIRGVSFTIWESGLTAGELLSGLSPAVSLWPLKDILHIQDGASAVGGWVDLDALGVVQQTFGGNGWRVEGFEVKRELSHLPREHEAIVFGKSGLFFGEEQTGQRGQKFYCYIETLLDFDLQPQGGAEESA